MTETSTAQRNTTTPNFSSPGSEDSAERKTSMQTKYNTIALAMYTGQNAKK
jgi:hypothetical protein